MNDDESFPYIFAPLALFLAILTIYLTACTYTINLAHTEGTATDTIDDTSTNTPQTSATLTGLPTL